MAFPRLVLKPSKLDGVGVWTTQRIEAGAPVLRFDGPTMTSARLPADDDVTGARDRYMQIGPDRYLGPSGKLDDHVNHSCAPNTAVRISPGKVALEGPIVRLVALAPIEADTEVTWDYSTTMLKDPWTMRCRCRSPRCRRTVKEWSRLPAEVQRQHVRSGMVPAYVLAAWKGPG
jgi:hypothetical protein